jgi:hypothetical protein
VTVQKFFCVSFVTGFLALFCKGFGFGVVRPDSGTVERLRVVWLLPSGATYTNRKGTEWKRNPSALQKKNGGTSAMP